MNVYARFDEITSLTLQDIKETLSMHICKSHYHSHKNWPLALKFYPLDMNVYARFDEIPSLTLQDIKETLSKELRITKGNNSHRIGP